MEVPIKFRAESFLGTVYGYFVKREGKSYIYNEAGTLISIDEKTLAQLVRYENGEEIYEEVK